MHHLLNKNLNTLVIREDFTTKDLSEAINIPLPTLNRLRSESQVNPTISSLIPICQYFNITLDQLLGFSPLLFSGEGKQESSGLNAIPLLNCDAVPYFEIQNELNDEPVIYTELPKNLGLYAMRVQATCWKVFQKDSLIFVSTNITPQNDDYVVVYSLSDMVVGVKQLIIDIEGTYLKSLNDTLDTIKLTSAYKISGVIVQAKYNFYQY